MLRLAVNHLSLVVLVKGYLSALVRSGDGIDIPGHYDHPSDRRTLPDGLDFEKGFMFHFSRFNSDLSELTVGFTYTAKDSTSIDVSSYVDDARNYVWSYCGLGVMCINRGITVSSATNITISMGYWANPEQPATTDTAIQVIGVRKRS